LNSIAKGAPGAARFSNSESTITKRGEWLTEKVMLDENTGAATGYFRTITV
jgi:hypothetical protein